MSRIFSAKSFFVAAVALGAVGAASAAHARTDLVFSVGIPAYVQPQPVYVQPEPVYAPAPVYVQPRVAYYDNDDWRWRHHHRFVEHRYGPWGDADHDGVPNRYDRAPNNYYRR